MATPDYQRLFESSPVLSVVLDRDYRIVAASDAFLAATMTTREAVVGKGAFEVFPSDPSRPEATGEPVVRKLLERVLAERRPQTLPLQRYDVPRPQAQGGGFERRYWTAEFVPLLGPDGEEKNLPPRTPPIERRAVKPLVSTWKGERARDSTNPRARGPLWVPPFSPCGWEAR